MGNIASFINNDLGIPVNTLPAEETGKLGLNKVLERPPFEQLPKHLQEFVRDLDGLEPVEQLNLIRQYTKDAIEYEANPNEQSDVTQNFSQTLANPKGDCDDIAVFEAGLIKYATEQGVAKFDDVAIVGGEISYDYQDSKGQARSADLSHNFLIISSNGQNFYSDPNAPQVGTFNQGNAVDGFLSGSDGSTVKTSVFFNDIEMVQSITSGTVSISPNTRIEEPSQSATPQMAITRQNSPAL